MGHSRPAEEGDTALFLAEIAGSQPLPDRGRVKPPAEAGRPRVAAAEALAVERDAVIGRAPGVGDAELAALSGGRPRPEASVDLHGLTEDAAAGALERFLVGALRAGRRCVLVVTGKGLHSPGGAILRHAVPELLAGRHAGVVRAFCPARPADGGAGALYVLLSPTRRSPP